MMIKDTYGFSFIGISKCLLPLRISSNFNLKGMATESSAVGQIHIARRSQSGLFFCA